MARGKSSKRTMEDYLNSKEQAQVEQSHESDKTSEALMHSSDEDEQSITSTKKGRGPACPIRIWGSRNRLKLQFNDFMQPIGKTSIKFSTQLDIMARNGSLVPLTYESWNDVPEENKNAIWHEVQDNTDSPLEFRKNCLEKVANTWRSWKHTLKVHYEKHKDDEDILTRVPDKRVQDEQWSILVRYWNEVEVKRIAKTNAENRKQKTICHRTGCKSFANVRHKRENKGLPTDRASVWLTAYYKRAGARSNEDTKEFALRLQNELSQIPESEQTAEVREKIFKKVIGDEKRGRVLTYGHGPSFKDVFGKISNVRQILQYGEHKKR
ncbi:hypothetical protein Scep_004888 [Stephania cephalantha]|uniref:Transposase, Ptta/En/Spm, plant n=1 Tax=Stephania cephalantha TaxID=152367 RepID=A0AAP0KUX2_9MAGN